MTEEVKPVATHPLPPDPDEQAAVFQDIYDRDPANAAALPDAEPASEPETPERPAWHDSHEEMERAEQFAQTNRAQRGQQLAQAYAAGQQAQQQLLADFQRVPAAQWEQLRASNPAEYMRLMSLYQEEGNKIAQHLAGVQEAARQFQTEHLQAEKELAMRARPEWRDPANFAAAREEMLDYARKAGFTRAEIENLSDHRQLLALYHASQAGKPQPQTPAVRLGRAKPADGRPAALVAAENRMKRDPRDDQLQGAYFEQLLRAGA